uniref:Androgen receptor n=1 Tax=Romanomermis culicivorax TaxID=13658 RepID=A0A915ICY4_ROMCU
ISPHLHNRIFDALSQQLKDVWTPARRTFPPPPHNYQDASKEPQPQPQQQLLQQHETPREPLPCAGDPLREMEACKE